jgi:hypothetical protein
MAKNTQLVSPEDLERFAGYNAIHTFREEIAITRLAIERTMNEAIARGHWNAYADSINGLIDTLIRLIEENRRIDPVFKAGMTCHSNEQQ